MSAETKDAYADMLPRPFEMHDDIFKVMQKLLKVLPGPQWDELAGAIDTAIEQERNARFSRA